MKINKTPEMNFFGGEGELEKVQCVVPENIHTSPMEGIFPRPPPPSTPLEIPIKLDTFL